MVGYVKLRSIQSKGVKDKKGCLVREEYGLWGVNGFVYIGGLGRIHEIVYCMHDIAWFSILYAVIKGIGKGKIGYKNRTKVSFK